MPDEADETAKKCVCGLYCMCVFKRGDEERKRGRKGARGEKIEKERRRDKQRETKCLRERGARE